MVTKKETVSELKAKLNPTQLRKLDFIVKMLKNSGTGSGEWEVLTYARGLLDLTWKQLKKKKTEDITAMISQALDKVYTLR